MEKRVGIRELKAKLSGYIQEVKRGSTVVITERGRAVGRITPEHESSEERIEDLVQSGLVAWSGKKLASGNPVAKLKRGKKTLAEIVSENRD